MGKVIVLLGPVGVGKSTIANYLLASLNSMNFRTIKTFMKSYHGLSYFLWAIMARMLGIHFKYAPWYELTRKYKNLSRVLGLISMYVDILFLVIKSLWIKLHRSFGYFVLVEECLQSTVLDYLFMHAKLKLDEFSLNFILRVLYALSIKLHPDVVVLLDANLHTLMNRWEFRRRDEPDLFYVMSQIKILPKIAEFTSRGSSGIFKIATDNLDIDDIGIYLLNVILNRE